MSSIPSHFLWCDRCVNDIDDDGTIWLHAGARVELAFNDDSGRSRRPYILELTHCADPDNGVASNVTLIYAAGWLLTPDEARRLAGNLTRLAALADQL